MAIESSYDETVTAVVKSGRTVLSNVISSQIATHTVYRDVVPEVAPREHIRAVNYVIERALAEAQATLRDITAIGATCGPGLVGTPLVGAIETKAIAYTAGKFLIEVHRIEGYVSANSIENQDLEPPFVCPTVSGGHTHSVIIKGCGEFEIIGRTKDDVVGEASDKMARSVGPGHLGGSKTDKTAKVESPHAAQLLRGRVEGAPYDFSLSGLKSVTLNHINHAHMIGEEIHVPGPAVPLQNSAVESPVSRAILAAHEFEYEKLAITSDIASNSVLRKAMAGACEKDGSWFYHPSPVFYASNVVMIGAAAHYEHLERGISGWGLNAIPDLELGEC